MRTACSPPSSPPSWSSACGGDERELVGLTRDPEPQVDGVALPDVSRGGAPFDFRAPDGGLLVVYFGYTNCPDVCPTTMADLRVALDDLGDDADAGRGGDGDRRPGP